MPLHKQHKPKFPLPNSIDPTAKLLSYLVFPDSLIETIVKYTIMYTKVRHNGLKKNFKRVTKDKILTFLAMYYYLRLVTCRAQKDY